MVCRSRARRYFVAMRGLSADHSPGASALSRVKGIWITDRARPAGKRQISPGAYLLLTHSSFLLRWWIDARGIESPDDRGEVLSQ